MQCRRANHDRAVWIAQDNARAHGDEAVHKEQAALEHPVVNDHRAVGLRGRHQHNAHQVGGKARPRRVADIGHGVVHVCLDTQLLTAADKQVVAANLAVETQPAKHQAHHAQVFRTGILDQQFAVRRARQPDKRADLDVIGADAEVCAVQPFDTLDGQAVGTDAVDLRAHLLQQPR